DKNPIRPRFCGFQASSDNIALILDDADRVNPEVCSHVGPESNFHIFSIADRSGSIRHAHCPVLETRMFSNQMPALANSVTIAITTKERWGELQTSLEHLVSIGLGTLPLALADDGSSIACPFSLSFWPGPVAVRRVDTPLGLIEQRNRLAHLIPTKYALSLDDDSYPVRGSLAAAVEFAERTSD